MQLNVTLLSFGVSFRQCWYMLIYLDIWLRKQEEVFEFLSDLRLCGWLWLIVAAGAGVARENIKIFTTETFSEVAPDAFLTLLFSKYAGRRPGNAQETQLLEHVGTCWNLFQGNIRKLSTIYWTYVEHCIIHVSCNTLYCSYFDVVLWYLWYTSCSRLDTHVHIVDAHTLIFIDFPYEW